MEKYWYSEGYVYLGNNCVCELFGTDIEKEEIGIDIAKALNKKYFDK